MVKHLAQKDRKYNPRRDALIWFVDLYHQTEDDPVGWAFCVGDDESHPEQFGFKTAQEAFTALENWWVSIPEYHRPGYSHSDVYVEDAGGTGYVDTFDWDTDVVQDKKEARVNFGQGINFFDMGLNRATVQQMLKSMGPQGDFRITDDSVFFENQNDAGKLKEMLMNASKKTAIHWESDEEPEENILDEDPTDDEPDELTPEQRREKSEEEWYQLRMKDIRENPHKTQKDRIRKTHSEKIGQALSGKEIADAIKTNVDNYMNDKISYAEMGHVQRLLWDRAKEADVEDYVLDVVGPKLNRQKFERETALIAKIDAAESFLAEAKANAEKFKRQAQEAQTEEALEYATSMTSEWAMTIEEAQNKLADANKALMELSKIFTEYDSYIEQSGVQKGATMKKRADNVLDVEMRKFELALPGNPTLLSTKEDMQWLRDVHIPTLSPNYNSAVIYGNEDYPNRIEVYEDENPTIEETPLVFLPDEEGNYVEKTGPKGAAVKKRAGIGTEVEGVDEATNTINYLGDYGPGKFNDNVTEYIYDIVMNGFSNQSLGESEGFGSYDLVIIDPPMTVNQEGGGPGGQGSWMLGAAILHEDSQGFVDVDTFDTADAALAVWAELEKEYEQFLGEVEEENEEAL